jgi:hypothetical protein
MAVIEVNVGSVAAAALAITANLIVPLENLEMSQRRRIIVLTENANQTSARWFLNKNPRIPISQRIGRSLGL